MSNFVVLKIDYSFIQNEDQSTSDRVSKCKTD